MRARSRLEWRRCLGCALVALAGAGAGARLPADCPDPSRFDRGPYLQQLTPTSVTLVSQSREPSRAVLRYGREGALEQVLAEEAPVEDHVFRLEGLDPGSVYGYELAQGERVWRSSLRTLPAAGGEVTVAVFGDSGAGSEAQAQVAGLLADLEPDLLLHTGDLAYPAGLPWTYQVRFFDVYGALLSRVPLFAVPGNHDCGVSGPCYTALFELPPGGPEGDELSYSFDAGPAHIVALNTCWEPSPEVLAWLEADLEAAREPWKIVFSHRPAYASGQHGGTAWMRRRLVPVFERCGVDLVFSGHDHLYERFHPIREGRARGAFQSPDLVAPGGVVYVVTGGGGGEIDSGVELEPEGLRDPDLSAVLARRHHAVRLRLAPGSVEVEALAPGGEVLDRFRLRKEGGPAAPLRFRPGDADEDGRVNLSDAVAILEFLFRGRREVCDAAADVTGSGGVSLSDAVWLLSCLFQGSPCPPGGLGACAERPGASTVGCRQSCT